MRRNGHPSEVKGVIGEIEVLMKIPVILVGVVKVRECKSDV